MPFIDRSDAGRKLAGALAGYKDSPGCPRAAARRRTGCRRSRSCTRRSARFDLGPQARRSRGAELAMGAVVDGAAPIVVRNEDVIRIAKSARPNSTPRGMPNWPKSSGAGGDTSATANGRMSRAGPQSSSTTALRPVRRSARLCAQPACANQKSLSLQCRWRRRKASRNCAARPTTSFASNGTNASAPSAPITRISSRCRTRK